MDGLIGEAQTRAIPNRSIQDNFHLLHYALEGFRSNPGKGEILIHLGQAKAFNRVDHQYLVSVLAQFGMGLSFLRWIIQLYDRLGEEFSFKAILN